jgi:dihydroorotate dehydrogenase electron transfer subunit
MLHLHCQVHALREVAPNIFVLAFHSPELSRVVEAGQFVNILAGVGVEPLLRRPFSIHRVDGDSAEIMFQRLGKGTGLLAKASKGDVLDILGPLGHGYRTDDPSFDTAVLVGGGLGVAPMPILTAMLQKAGKNIITLIGARTAPQVVDAHLVNVKVATDDGSEGHRGTAVDLAAKELDGRSAAGMKIFACGPTPMLRALGLFAQERGIACEVSLEGQMACGIGICQGCPVEVRNGDRKYALMCKDGPVFNIQDIVI